MTRSVLAIACLAMLCFSGLASAQTNAESCNATPTTLCLDNDRFQVEVNFADFLENDSTVGSQSISGSAGNSDINENWGLFFFFSPNIADFIVHVFDGCSGFDRFWVFAAATTNVEFDLTVTDTASGESRTYYNPLGMPAEAITDTEAFATCPRRKLSPPAKPVPPARKAVQVQTPKMACSADATTACLYDRYAVTVDVFGSSSPVEQIAEASAVFPFSNPTFFDLLVNVVDGRPNNGQFWVHYSLFNPVDMTLTVTDTETGVQKIYSHSASDPLVILDNAAFTGEPITVMDGTFAGSWFNALRDGEGFIFDIVTLNGAPTLVLYYFTYENNTSGRQAWVVGAGPIIGNRASIPVTITDGGQFGVGFDSDDINQTPWGFVELTVNACDEIRMESHSSLFPDVDYLLRPITNTPTGVQGVCAGDSAKAITPTKTHLEINGAMNGSWFNRTRDGEGFIFNVTQVNDVPALVLYYFTFEDNDSGHQAWLVGSAPITGDSIEVPVLLTDGAQWGDNFDPGDVNSTPAGTITVEFLTCGSANIDIQSSLLGNLNFDIERITPTTIGATGQCAM